MSNIDRDVQVRIARRGLSLLAVSASVTGLMWIRAVFCVPRTHLVTIPVPRRPRFTNWCDHRISCCY